MTLQQKSVYLIILNATMILRSIGRTLKQNHIGTTADYKRSLFNKLEHLTACMDDGRLTEEQIIKTIKALAAEFDISIGQSQKAINVILKFHFYLSTKQNKTMRKVLHCPVDKIILHGLKWRQTSLNKIDLQEYRAIQREIAARCTSKIEFDRNWDIQLLQKNGIVV
jgi:hypothetical protein